eukprot:gnl/TRDRNA2_/TRDRNA2_189126_c0_seq1.p2 gnl/TRDRNA2_/TRDRNA2_189126_c0~~gnl/TRDRNA2_/TRDRNA2_189126_c0_seq1.p2  ORF type:complete len:142 (-),score=29.11 gnl/TRDRNA2_/TRDRNA2_189126_c0_seq1:190-615(-)
MGNELCSTNAPMGIEDTCSEKPRRDRMGKDSKGSGVMCGTVPDGDMCVVPSAACWAGDDPDRVRPMAIGSIQELEGERISEWSSLQDEKHLGWFLPCVPAGREGAEQPRGGDSVGPRLVADVATGDEIVIIDKVPAAAGMV